MRIGQRTADASDVERIVELYGPAQAEQVALREPWALTDGLADPPAVAIAEAMADPAQQVVVGTIDDVTVGFALATIDEMLPQARGERIGVIRLIYVEDPARAVGVAEAMLAAILEWFDGHGLKRFDAIVSPGHRLAKNFFESAGFKARRITMYRHDG